MKTLYLLAMLFGSACSATPAGQSSFWTQKTQLNAIGLNIVTEIGIINAGTVTWSRNVDNPPEVETLSGAIKARKP